MLGTTPSGSVQLQDYYIRPVWEPGTASPQLQGTTLPMLTDARRNLGFTTAENASLPPYAQKMGASRKDLADAIQSYSDNDSHL